MTDRGRNIAAGLVLLALVMPSGLCSGIFTVGGIANLFGRDSVAQAAATVMLIGATVGWIFCILMIGLWRRLRPCQPDPASGT